MPRWYFRPTKGKEPPQANEVSRGGEMADTQSSEGCPLLRVWVQLPPSAPKDLLGTLSKVVEYTKCKSRIYGARSTH